MPMKLHGLSLVETLLVLAVGSLLVVMGIRMYNSVRRVNDVQVLGANVTNLFSAAANYYYANCSRMVTTGGIKAPQYPTNTTISVNLATDLNLPATNLLYSSMVDPTTYVVQFQVTAQPKIVSTGPGTTANVGTILLWKMQVAVALLLDRTNATQALQAERLRTMLNASCFTELNGTTGGNATVYPCSSLTVADQTNTGLNYLSWEEMPSQARIANSAFSWSSTYGAAFNQWVQSYSPAFLINNPGSAAQQYYSCQS